VTLLHPLLVYGVGLLLLFPAEVRSEATDPELFRDFRNNVFQHVMRGGPQGGGYSTVGDLLKFDRALRSNRLVSARSVELLLSPKPEFHSLDYGFGFQVDPALRIAGHSGGFTGINSNLDMFLDSGWTAIVLSNYSWGTWWVQGKMRELVAASE
jgi:hypothetical protein